MLDLIFKTVWYFLPAYLANMAPPLAQYLFPKAATPVDFGRTIQGKQVFGVHKTWRGVFASIIIGGTVFVLQRIITPGHLQEVPLWFGILMGLGAILGDLAKSFAKRRIGIVPGKPWIPFDQLDFYLGALVLSAPFYLPNKMVILTGLILTPLLHIAVNHIGFWLKIQKVKW